MIKNMTIEMKRIVQLITIKRKFYLKQTGKNMKIQSEAFHHLSLI